MVVVGLAELGGGRELASVQRQWALWCRGFLAVHSIHVVADLQLIVKDHKQF